MSQSLQRISAHINLHQVMELSRESLYIVNMDICDQKKSTKFRANQTGWKTRVCRASLSVLIIAILPNCVAPSEYDCGINRFNNESPLTERIVGGNNSLQ